MAHTSISLFLIDIEEQAQKAAGTGCFYFVVFYSLRLRKPTERGGVKFLRAVAQKLNSKISAEPGAGTPGKDDCIYVIGSLGRKGH